ncbi:SusC/RagA family TonB-linked outer membrane protein [Mucilaginibacter terrae]|uniref:TonB-linked SusC/RagA family outer membrane protein n=1 Tax=Mucilaginibacter terrae TaxID=1955052 RepID=A0ABU3GQE9_9SPHI|nr:SusC/RagA family TonB-linked outer membrane protein [Mucilaginibacter terrae]MDT3402009.1 TonB-linked SusC/RagA family outer membrane protein [Mucilaginibacter terrae]
MRKIRLNNIKYWKYCSLIILLNIISIATYAQTFPVKGKVVDEKNEPLAGATVSITGTTTATSATVDGNFTLNVPNGTKSITISFIGYTDVIKNITPETANVGAIALGRASGKDLTEVVVIGYGTQRREAVTGSVASIGGEKLRDVPAPNISQALQGRLPGVELTQTNTKPGANMQILIRGQRSLTASNDPLIVLDGIPFVGNLGDINPNDVKSIDILKDASATAIYGSRGANGVILVTTNRGQAGADAKITYNAYAGAQTVFARYDMMNGPEFLALRKAANLYTTPGIDEADNVNTDWQDLLYRTGYVNSHDVGVSGGSKGGAYNFGGGYYQNQGVIPTQRYTRYTFRASVDQAVGQYVKVGFTNNSNYNLTQGNQVGIYGNLSNSPLANPYNADGSLKRTIKMPLDESYVFTRGVVEGLQDKWLDETRAFASYNSMYGEVKIPGVKGLKYRLNLGLDYRQSNYGSYTGQGVGSTNVTELSRGRVDNSHNYHWTVENLLTYDRTFAEKHSINVLALYSAEQNKFNSSFMTARNIPSDAFQFYNLGQALVDPVIGDGVYQVTGLNSWMGRVLYAYDNRYFLSATLRADGSSRLAPGKKWKRFPAVSAGWNITNESFAKGISFLDNLKITGGYGQTANQAVGPYQTLGTLGIRQYNFGDSNFATGYDVTRTPNDALGWEYSDTWNAAIDFSVLKHRLTGRVEYYLTNTKNLLLDQALPSTAGVSAITANVGRSQNRGVELALNGTILDNPKGLTWDLGVNLYLNRNKLVALTSGQDRNEGNSWFVGYNINSIFDYQYQGLWQQGDQYLSVLEPGGNVGMIKVKYTGDYNANGQPVRPIGAADRQIIETDPDFQGGFNTRLAYKGFDFNMVGVFKSGGILNSTLYGSGGYLNLLTGRRNNINVDYWTPSNTGARYPKPGGILSGDNPKYGSTLGYFDASYLKIRTITLGYDLNKLMPKVSTFRARAYFTVQNAFVLFSPYHKESGMDPETNSYGNENAAVALPQSQRRLLTIGTNTPSTRNFILGLNVSF